MQPTLFRFTRTRALVAFVAVAGMIGLAGCQSGPSIANQQVAFHIQPSRTKVLVGDTVTLTTYTQNVTGVNASIHWTAAGGHIQVLENGGRARVTYDDPGIYYVIADLMVNGVRARVSSVAITVVPVTRNTLPTGQGQDRTQQNSNSNNGMNNNMREGNDTQNQNQMQQQDQTPNNTNMYK